MIQIDKKERERVMKNVILICKTIFMIHEVNKIMFGNFSIENIFMLTLIAQRLKLYWLVYNNKTQYIQCHLKTAMHVPSVLRTLGHVLCQHLCVYVCECL